MKRLLKWGSTALIALLVVALFGVATGVFDVQVMKSQGYPYFLTLKIATRLIGAQTWRGSHSFAWRGAPTQAQFDTVYVKGTLPGDFVWISRKFPTGSIVPYTEVNQLKGYITSIYGTAATDSIYVSRNDTTVKDSVYNYLIIR